MHITDVTIQPNGEVVVNSGSNAGDDLLRIDPKNKALLCEKLGKDIKIDPMTLSKKLDNQIIMLFNLKFSVYPEDPHSRIEAFLKEQSIPYQSQYWVNSR